MNEATGANILSSPLTIQLGDTVQFLPLDPPTMMHTITSTGIPAGAVSFDQMWQLPADTFFQYIPSVVGVYNFECTPHVSMNMIGSFTVVSGGVGISEIAITDNLLLFPNPVIKEINITVKESLLDKPFVLYNNVGKIVLSGKINSMITIVDTNELVPGNYFFVISDNKNQGLKIIKE